MKQIKLKIRLEEKNLNIIKEVFEKIKADAIYGTNYILEKDSELFYCHDDNSIYNAKVEVIGSNLYEVTLPIMFMKTQDFFSMFFSILGETLSFHKNIFLEDFEISFPIPSFDGIAKYKRYLQKEPPYLGTIVKPNLCSSMQDRLGLIRKLMEFGVDFLKDDEVFGLESFEDFKKYVSDVNEIKRDFKCIFCFNITPYISRLDEIIKLPIDAVMINFLALGFSKSFEVIQELKDKCLIHGHRTGLTFYGTKISNKVILKLACMLGMDSTHFGTPLLINIPKETEKYPLIGAFTKLSPMYVKPLIKAYGKNILFIPCGGIYKCPDGIEKGIKSFKDNIT